MRPGEQRLRIPVRDYAAVLHDDQDIGEGLAGDRILRRRQIGIGRRQAGAPQIVQHARPFLAPIGGEIAQGLIGLSGIASENAGGQLLRQGLGQHLTAVLVGRQLGRNAAGCIAAVRL